MSGKEVSSDLSSNPKPLLRQKVTYPQRKV